MRGTCHTCQRRRVVEPCPYWLDVDDGDPELKRACCAECRVECAADI